MSFIVAAVAGGAALAVGTTAGTALAVGVGAGGLVAANKSKNATKGAQKSADKATQAQYDLGTRQQDLAEKQYADQLKLFEEFKPQLKEQLTKSIEAQDLATSQSNDQWASYKSTWQPIESQLAQKSLDYASPARAEQEASRAAADTTSAFDTARGESRRSLEMAGASPEKIAALEASGRLQEAKAVGGAQSAARREVDSKGMAYLDNASRFGRNMPSTGIATAQLSNQTGQSVQSNYGGLVNATSAPADSARGLFNGASAAYSSSGNLALGSGNLALGQAKTNNDVFGDVVGAGLQAYGMFGSSEKTKDIKGGIDGDAAADAVAASPSKEWSYKPGLGDGNTKARMGPTAESLNKVAPEVSDGEQVDGIAMLGLHHAAIGATTKRLARLEKRIGLSDARRA